MTTTQTLTLITPESTTLAFDLCPDDLFSPPVVGHVWRVERVERTLDTKVHVTARLLVQRASAPTEGTWDGSEYTTLTLRTDDLCTLYREREIPPGSVIVR